MVQVFLSHTKKDKEFCDWFDTICARVGIKAFRSEFEKINPPEWETIKIAINKSDAVFFLVGKELVKNQDFGDSGWRYTQNWIAYEIGVACQKGIDVWAICDGVSINFPMPYVNNYLAISLKQKKSAWGYLKGVLDAYHKGNRYSSPYYRSLSVIVNNKFQTEQVCLEVGCPNCQNHFNLHTTLKPGDKIKCPKCLRNIIFPRGFPIIF